LPGFYIVVFVVLLFVIVVLFVVCVGEVIFVIIEVLVGFVINADHDETSADLAGSGGLGLGGG